MSIIRFNRVLALNRGVIEVRSYNYLTRVYREWKEFNFNLDTLTFEIDDYALYILDDFNRVKVLTEIPVEKLNQIKREFSADLFMLKSCKRDIDDGYHVIYIKC